MEKTLRLAAAFAFNDAKIVPWETGSVLVLFAKYTPAEHLRADSVCVSAYYAASHAAYVNAGKLADALREDGILAKRDASLPAKQIAIRSGGWMGKNGFYYHPSFGSLVHIQTLLLNAVAQPACGPSSPGCKNCGMCIAACPCGAISQNGADRSKCMRSHMNTVVPDEYKPHIYQLFGCEKCQTACPQNIREAPRPLLFDLEKTIRGKTMDELRRLAGKNVARYVRTVNQAILYAANAGNASLAPLIAEMAADRRFADACRYYLDTLGKGD